MILSSDFLLKLYDACYIARWNDFLRIFDITELDNQGFKIILAYVLSKIEEKEGKNIDWVKLIKYFIFDFLNRIVLTDIKPEILDKIEENTKKLNEYSLDICRKFLNYTLLEEYKDFLDLRNSITFDKFTFDKSDGDDLIVVILHISGKLSSKFEFDKFIKNFNAEKIEHECDKFSTDFDDKKFKEKYGLKSVREIFSKDYLKFLNICFSLRYQIRWTGKYRIPRTSVLGHEVIVGIILFIFFYENDLTNFDVKTIYNDFFTAIFHDLPEALTRDIISPIKHSSREITEIIKNIENKEMEKIYKILPEFIKKDLKIFTENEFSDLYENIGNKKNIIRHGRIIKQIDSLSAIIEAYIAVNDNGIKNKDFINCCSKKNLEKCIKEFNEFSDIYKINNNYDFLERFILS